LRSNVGSRAFQNAKLQKQARKRAEAVLPAAIKAYTEGRHAEAQALCRQILADLPNHFDALHLLGVSAIDSGQFEEAASVLARAVDLDPRSAEAQSNLGLALFKLRRYDEARTAQEKALALKPKFPTALTNLGNTLMRLRRFDEAIAAHDQAIALKSDYGDAYCNRGMALLLSNRNEEAVRSFDRALSFHPRHVPALLGIGLANLNLRNFDVALSALNSALAIQPQAAGVIAQRGRIFQQLGHLEKAETEYDTALELDPQLEPALCGKASVSVLLGKVAPAISASLKVLAQNPCSEVALTLLGACYAMQGDIVSAIEHYDRALGIAPDYEEAIAKKIFALDFLPDVSFERMQEARRYWWDAIGSRLPRQSLVARDLDPKRRIVVGYVSADFRDHSAALAFVPILRHHDRAKFEIIAYSCSPLHDTMTDLCRMLVDRWVDAWQLTDAALADRIQGDKVDILVDLSGHTAGHRLGVFARKPAPVQVTAIGSATGTGVRTMDYLLADRVVVPESVRHLYAEKIHELPCIITIEPPRDIKPTALPMLRNGHVTFGMLNRTDKISDAALTLWCRIMHALPGSVIVVKNGSMSDPSLRDGLLARFGAYGLSEGRVRCIGRTSRQEHLAMFAEIDIALDPFPQNGGISTWEPLQLGVPVITKLGRNSQTSRIGASIVKAVGLDDWVAESDEDYFVIALKYASRPSELAALRAGLPAQVANSAAGDCAIYTGHVEDGYRKFWRDYCAGATAC
jgi:predicted O-linked N-acetylglucosamine transferase (SPINDLY family)